MKLSPEALITVFSDGVAMILICGLLTLSDRNRKKKNYEYQLFDKMCGNVLMMTVLNAACYIFTKKSVERYGTLAVILYSGSAVFAVLFVCRWIAYLDYQIYRVKDHIKRRYRFLAIIPVIIFAALIVNLFVRFMFSVDKDLYIVHYTVFYPMVILELFGFFYPGYELYRFSKKNRVHFFYKSWSIVIPILLNAAVSLFTFYSVGALCFACAVVFLYFSMMNRWRFVDEGSGFYNMEYMDFLDRMKSSGQRRYEYVLSFTGKGSVDAFCDILKKEIPQKGEIIRKDECEFWYPVDITNKSILKSMGQMVLLSASEFDDSHPGEEIDADFDIFPFDSYKDNRTVTVQNDVKEAGI